MTICELTAAIFLIAASVAKAGDVCISGESDGNSAFLGTYSQETGTSYYTKSQCDGSVAYLYQQNSKWQVYTALNSNTAYLRCPTASDSPQECPTGTWKNGGATDASLSVQTGSCPSTSPSISCDRVYIDSADYRCYGYFDAVSGEEGLYSKQCGTDYVYFYYNGYFERWECGPKDERDVCDAYDNDNMYYIKSTDTSLDSLSSGSSVTAALDFPTGTSAGFYCDCSPQVACSYLEIANVGNGNDGVYQRDSGEQNLFLNADSTRYFLYAPERGSTATAANPLSSCGSLSAYFRSSDTTFSTVAEGDVDVSINVEYPSNVDSATISCLAEPPTPPPTEEPGENDMCVAVAQWISSSPNNWFVSGKYQQIADLNGHPAYQLYGCETEYGASTQRYLRYSNEYQEYIVSPGLYTSGYYFRTTNGATSPIGATWNYPQYVEVKSAASRSGGCGCSSEPLTGATVPVPIEQIAWSTDSAVEGGIWAQFLQMLANDQTASMLTVTFLILCACGMVMCAYCMGYARGATKVGQPFKYSKAKVVFDHEDENL
eukprot:CAMPEP_0197023926 /NCGR_PEP_ID=MMETSP1384-20130603/4583_1 /TAXON_ID=29189 /ORGANISM="Ammonia sp." /LENGTH=544 /DNA_ID=CAMNT_0042452239 /DNA_START=37 /DNA_END=1671 /DNA_ORIENTATION=-